MAAGVGLNDEQRLPWLLKLHDVLSHQNESTILACSALKRRYRLILNKGLDEQKNLDLVFILLNISYELAEKRLKSRSNHDFLKSDAILKSQFEALELDDKKDDNYESKFHIIIDLFDACLTPDNTVNEILKKLNK
jgi:gluconokinase